MKIGKMIDGRIVQIVRTADTVQFSTHTGWVFICFDFDKINRRRDQFKWIPAADAKFMWVKEFVETS